MTASFARELLGWIASKGRYSLVPNCADTDSEQSVKIAGEMLNYLGVPAGVPTDVTKNPGPALESMVEADLGKRLIQLRPDREWEVKRGRVVTNVPAVPPP